MKKLAQLAAILGVLAMFTLYVTAESPHQSSSAPNSSAFELIQCSTTTNISIRLNKMTGDAWYMLDNKKGNGPAELSWVRIPLPPAPLPPAKGDGPQYQVYISGAGFSAVYMLHLSTGKTWVLSGQAGPRVDPKLTWVEIAES